MCVCVQCTAAHWGMVFGDGFATFFLLFVPALHFVRVFYSLLA